jgi:transcriptional regulator GlxA family with amidase domain
MKTKLLPCLEVFAERDDYVEIGIVKYPDYLESGLFGLTELFAVANRFAMSHKDKQHSVIRVTHWQASPTNPTRIELVFDSHPGASRSVPRILISPPSITEPISSEAATPYVNWLVRLHGRGTVVASICGGAFLLAEAKLLDGRTVTTHWFYADVFRQRFPAVDVDPNKLIIDDADIITAGGMTAWTDLGIFLIRRVLGPTVMLETARFMLVDPSGREQSYYGNFLPHLHHGDVEILKVQHWLQKNSCRNVDLTKMAQTAGLEVRTFIRRFKTATSLKPTEYCQRLRIGKAREMLECTRQSVEKISWAVGYEDPASFRRIFHKIVGLSPSEYRRRFSVGLDKENLERFWERREVISRESLPGRDSPTVPETLRGWSLRGGMIASSE